jgi:hypothetical protein
MQVLLNPAQYNVPASCRRTDLARLWRGCEYTRESQTRDARDPVAAAAAAVFEGESPRVIAANERNCPWTRGDSKRISDAVRSLIRP